jgi:hypothetical protein
MPTTFRFSSTTLLLCATLTSTVAFSASITRGPYLQMGTDKSMTVRWRTDTATNSVVRYGSSASNLSQTADNSANGTEHEVKITGLAPLTQYYYSIGSDAETIAGGDNSYRFKTSPSENANTPTRIFLMGDSGTESTDAENVYNAYLNYPGAENTNLWIMLGDNAYNDGTDTNYQRALFNMYPTLLRRTPLWSTMGNHDGHSADSNSQSGPYFDIFSFPKNAEAGGLASGTEAYYSFNYGNIHFISLDSYGTDRSSSGAMMSWLRNDLAVTNKKWIIAFWHHPAYSKGSHDSDSEDELIEMRQNALPVLESYGVDLVLSGHSHSYERSFLLNGHYKTSDTLNSSHIINNGDGRDNGDGAYKKANGGNSGAVYTVAGASGHATGGDLDHPAMFSSLNEVGSVVLDINNDRLDAKYLGSDGSVLDHYSVIKGQNTTTPIAQVETQESTPPENHNDTKHEPTTIAQRSILSSSEDTYISSGAPNKNYSAVNAILADGSDDSNEELVSLIKWDVSGIPSGTVINKAKIELEVFDSSSDEYDLYSNNTHWKENTATWNEVSPYSNRGSKIGSFFPSSTGTYVVNLNSEGKSLVQSWVNGSQNNGILMMSAGTYEDGVDMRSGNSNRPKLVINYDGTEVDTTVTAQPSSPVVHNQPTNNAGSGTVVLQEGLNGYYGTQDTYLAEGESNSNFGNDASILVDGYDDARKELISFLKWDVSSIPAGARITGVSLTINTYDGSDEKHNIRAIKTAWSESSATWSNMQPQENRGTKLGSFSSVSPGSYSINFNVDGISLVQSWINGAANNGFSIENNAMHHGSDGIDMRSSEYSTQTERPKLTITYQ